ncbi:hypothetical protein OG21DRAFT_547215 [Imleria badia]|nr:hypothetical protein OG21DRAFT_547215 [Imleria badia]
MVSFDNTNSSAAKGKFIKDNGLRGLAMREAGGDYHDFFSILSVLRLCLMRYTRLLLTAH